MTRLDPRRVHQWDTLTAFSRDLAEPVAVFYRQLCAHGMAPDTARLVTIAWLTILLDSHPTPGVSHE